MLETFLPMFVKSSNFGEENILVQEEVRFEKIIHISGHLIGLGPVKRGLFKWGRRSLRKC